MHDYQQISMVCMGNDMKKKDRRSIYTENVIKDVVIQLLNEKPINKITVTEVCKIADINRGTFYLHYKDCLDVLEKLQDEYSDSVLELLEKNKHLSHLESIFTLHEHNRQNKRNYLILLRTDLPLKAFKKITKYGEDRIINYLCSSSSLSKQEAKWIAEYMVSASIGIIKDFDLEDANMVHREEILQQFIGGGLQSIINKNQKR